jgi:hypothetical protein
LITEIKKSYKGSVSDKVHDNITSTQIAEHLGIEVQYQLKKLQEKLVSSGILPPEPKNWLQRIWEFIVNLFAGRPKQVSDPVLEEINQVESVIKGKAVSEQRDVWKLTPEQTNTPEVAAKLVKWSEFIATNRRGSGA